MKPVQLALSLLLASLPALPAQAQSGHITRAAVDRIASPAERATPRAARIPGGMGGSAGLFAGKPWWAVLQMCSEHRAGAGRPLNAPAPRLAGEAERNRRFFTSRAAFQFARDSDLTGPAEAEMPVAGWGLNLAASMNSAAASGEWSSDEFEDACRILGTAHARGV